MIKYYVMASFKPQCHFKINHLTFKMIQIKWTFTLAHTFYGVNVENYFKNTYDHDQHSLLWKIHNDLINIIIIMKECTI